MSNGGFGITKVGGDGNYRARGIDKTPGRTLCRLLTSKLTVASPERTLLTLLPAHAGRQ